MSEELLAKVRSEIAGIAEWIEYDWTTYPDSDLTDKVTTLLFQSAFLRPVEIWCDSANCNAASITFLGVPRPLAFRLAWLPALPLSVAISFVLPYYVAGPIGTGLETIESMRDICARHSLNICRLLEEAGYTFLPHSIAYADFGTHNDKPSNETIHSLLFI